MAKLTRRVLLKQISAGAAAIGALLALPGLATGHAAATRATELPKGRAHEPLVAYIRDAATGEIALLIGAREVIVRDPELVTRLLTAAR